MVSLTDYLGLQSIYLFLRRRRNYTVSSTRSAAFIKSLDFQYSVQFSIQARLHIPRCSQGVADSVVHGNSTYVSDGAANFSKSLSRSLILFPVVHTQCLNWPDKLLIFHFIQLSNHEFIFQREFNHRFGCGASRVRYTLCWCKVLYPQNTPSRDRT